MTHSRGPRGYALLFVVLVLLVMTIAAGAYFEVTGRSQLTSMAVSGQQLAYLRAQAAVQEGIRDIRAGRVSVVALPAYSEAPSPAACVGDLNCVARSGLVDAALDLSAGGGLQWDYVIYRLNQGGMPGNRYIIQGNGYYGYATTSPSFTSSQVEVEIDVGRVPNSSLTETGGGMSGRLVD